MSPLPTWQELRWKYLQTSLLATLPACLIGPPLVGIVLGLTTAQIIRSLYTVLLFVVVFIVGGLQFWAAGECCRPALEKSTRDRPGDRLRRILELPRKLEIYSLWVSYVLGATVYTFGACWLFDKSYGIVPIGALIGLALVAVVGIPTTLTMQQHLLPVALDEFHTSPKTHPTLQGLFAPRQGWYLPYTFAVLAFAILVSAGVILSKKFLDGQGELLTALREKGDSALTSRVEGMLADVSSDVAVWLGVVSLMLLFIFLYSARAMARREETASRAMQECLQNIALGNISAPAYVSTDEDGDVAFALASVGVDIQTVFHQLQEMAQGNLSVELQGDTGLVASFKGSQRALRRLANQMKLLSRGDTVTSSELAGDLGKAFSQLSAALGATIAQAKTIAQGDLRPDMDASGELGAAIHQMTTNLRAMVGQTQEVGQNIGQIVVSLRTATTELSTATTEQVAALTETANTMTEMAQTSAASADRCAELISQGAAATTVVDEGRSGAQDAGEAMTNISTSLAKVATASSVLADKVQQVDGIIETVGFLADQSSTLAINASIEASRAGDAGRGFAAVAREMRTLASDSRKATAQIREILQEIREKTVQVDGAVAAGTGTVEEGVRLVNRLGDAIGQLGVTIHDAVGLMRQIEGSARQHQAGVNQVSQALRSMQAAAESIRDGARLLADLAEQEHQLATRLKSTAGAYQLPAKTT